MTTMILTIAMLLTTVAVIAEDRQGGLMGGPQQGQMEGSPRRSPLAKERLFSEDIDKHQEREGNEYLRRIP